MTLRGHGEEFQIWFGHSGPDGAADCLMVTFYRPTAAQILKSPEREFVIK